MKCLWCGRAHRPFVDEHIFPESLGCPKELVFRHGEVCKSCNHKLSYLDRAVCAEFEIHRWMAGVKTKGGKHPKVTSYGNLAGGFLQGQPWLEANMEKHAVTARDGRRIGAYRKRERDISASLHSEGKKATFTIHQDAVCNTRPFARGLHKIALEVFAFYRGIDKALQNRLDTVRQYVVDGVGNRIILLGPCAKSNEYAVTAWPPDGPAGTKLAVRLRIGSIFFAVDLSPNQILMESLKMRFRQVYGSNWTWAPIDPKKELTDPDPEV